MYPGGIFCKHIPDFCCNTLPNSQAFNESGVGVDHNKTQNMIEEDLLDMGEQAQDKGNYDLAVVYYRRAIEANPRDLDAAKRLGHIFCILSDFQAAADVYGTAIRYLEDHSEGSNALGSLYLCLCEAYLRLSRFVEAEEQVAKAAQFDVGDAELHATQGHVYFALGHYHKAVLEFEKVINLTPDAAEGYLDKARVYQKQERFDFATEILTAAQQLAPEDYNVEIALGSLATRMQQFESALNHYQRANDLAPLQPITKYSVGAAYLNLGDYDKAKQTFEGVVEECPKNADAMYSLAVAEMEKGGETRAISLLNSAIKVDPNNVRYHVLLTKAYLTTWKLFQAFQTASTARKLSAKQKT